MLGNMAPVAAKAWLQSKEAKVTNGGTTYAALTVRVSFYTGKDENGVAVYDSKFIDLSLWDREKDKMATRVLNDPAYAQGAALLLILEPRLRKQTGIYYTDKNGQPQLFKNGLQTIEYDVDSIGLRSVDPRVEGAASAPAAAAAAPAAASSTGGASAAPSDVF